jgi:hypothetical protein
MQVRADTRSCEAFSLLRQSPKPQPTAKPGQKPPPPKRAEPQPGRLCNWGRLILVAAIIIVILLIAFGAYKCATRSPAPRPTPTPTVAPTSAPSPTSYRPTPTPPPTPIPVNYYSLGTYAKSPPYLIIASDAQEATTIPVPGPYTAPPNTIWVLVTVTVTNGGSSPVSMGATYFSIVDSMGFTYGAHQPPDFMPNHFGWSPGTLGPGETVSGRILFQVPVISSGMDIQILINGQYLAWMLPW